MDRMRSAPPDPLPDRPAPPEPARTVGSLLAGARVLRRIGTGARADVYLGRIDDRAVALKVLRPPTPQHDAERELAALCAAAGPHVVAVLDVATTPDGVPVIVLESLQPRSLGAVLAERDDVSPGEAITLLHPIAAAVDRMHGAGVAHGALVPRAVLFRADGAPVLAAFGAARVGLDGSSPAARDADPLLRDDVAALRPLALAVLDRVADDGPAVVALREWLRAHDGSDLPAQLAERVFDLGEAEPVRMAAVGATPVIPGRTALGGRPTSQPTAPAGLWRLVPEEARSLVPEQLRSRTAALLSPRSVSVSVDSPAPDGTGGPAAGVRRALATVRRPYWVAAGASVLLFAGATVGVAALESGDDAAADPTGGSTAAPTAEEGGPPSPSPDATAPARDAHAAPGSSADPAAADAAVALLARRAECFEALDPVCLDEVGHEGSAVLAEDRRALEEGIAAGRVEAPWPDPTTHGPVESVQELGGAVLVRIPTPERGPASVLMIRTEAGWRLRDVVAEAQMPS